MSLTQQVVAQGDSALEDSSGDAQSTDNGAEPTGGGGTEGPSDGAEPTNGGTERPSDGAEESALTPDDADDTRQDFDEYVCNSLTKPPSCHCSGADDCVKMVLSGQCKDDTWKDLGDNYGRCDWNV